MGATCCQQYGCIGRSNPEHSCILQSLAPLSRWSRIDINDYKTHASLKIHVPRVRSQLGDLCSVLVSPVGCRRVVSVSYTMLSIYQKLSVKFWRCALPAARA